MLVRTCEENHSYSLAPCLMEPLVDKSEQRAASWRLRTLGTRYLERAQRMLGHKQRALGTRGMAGSHVKGCARMGVDAPGDFRR